MTRSGTPAPGPGALACLRPIRHKFVWAFGFLSPDCLEVSDGVQEGVAVQLLGGMPLGAGAPGLPILRFSLGGRTLD